MKDRNSLEDEDENAHFHRNKHLKNSKERPVRPQRRSREEVQSGGPQ